ncbi:AAA family ATPase [Ornithinimicrobium sp. Y1694]|uniref:AAA family ATPase n=1 Tax=Ornithinimicrobium sp. Y1694 TaxID=3418590 RepID=UPI003CF98171
MKSILLGVADQVISSDLVSRIEALEDFEISHISESTQELLPAVLNHNPDVVILDKDLPPGPISRLMQDLTIRRPALPVLLATRSADEESLTLGIQVGARAVLAYPFVLAEVNDSLVRATEWGERMRDVLAGGTAGEHVEGGVTTFAGSKGGVGTTIISSHVGWRLASAHRDKKIALVDLDLEKGDVTSYVDLSYRVSIVDLAKIADDISDRIVRDTVAVHESGLHILPAPLDIRDVDAISAAAIRAILSQLRSMYDIVLVDAGSNVTPAQATAIEMSDHVVQVVTTDVPSLRAARRQAQAWSDLGVRNPADVQVLVNRYSRDAEIQQSTIDRLVLGQRMETLVPDLGRGLEASINTRTPGHSAPKTWGRTLDAMIQEAEIVTAPPPEPKTTRRPFARSRKATSEDGQVALETVGVLPVTVMLLLVLWQIVGLSLSFLWAGHAANAAAREASLGSTHAQVRQAALEAVPSGVRGAVTVNTAGNQVSVQVKVAPVGSGSSVSDIGVARQVVKEP